ncbi:hypothetical protein PG997_004852 [Apiospora hydei]|uniref:Uncharacterized protein n=1 Tax=Apiospora hydei TaxID=1337664 RepID=A0ABR1X3C4_9PEZI
MAQGTIKKPAAAPSFKATKSDAGKVRKGARMHNKKKATNADRVQKKLSSGLVARTEKLLGERAGHLEMIGKGRDKTGKKKKAEEAKKAGGSRKFG